LAIRYIPYRTTSCIPEYTALSTDDFSKVYIREGAFIFLTDLKQYKFLHHKESEGIELFDCPCACSRAHK